MFFCDVCSLILNEPRTNQIQGPVKKLSHLQHAYFTIVKVLQRSAITDPRHLYKLWSSGGPKWFLFSNQPFSPRI